MIIGNFKGVAEITALLPDLQVLVKIPC